MAELRRKAVIIANGFRCRYCGGRARSVDHIVPTKRGGADEARNMTCACHRCNSRKGARRFPKRIERDLLAEAWAVEPTIHAIMRSMFHAQRSEPVPVDLVFLGREDAE